MSKNQDGSQFEKITTQAETVRIDERIMDEEAQVPERPEMVAERREQFEKERMTRRTVLRRIGLMAGSTSLGLLFTHGLIPPAYGGLNSGPDPDPNTETQGSSDSGSSSSQNSSSRSSSSRSSSSRGSSSRSSSSRSSSSGSSGSSDSGGSSGSSGGSGKSGGSSGSSGGSGKSGGSSGKSGGSSGSSGGSGNSGGNSGSSGGSGNSGGNSGSSGGNSGSSGGSGNSGGNSGSSGGNSGSSGGSGNSGGNSGSSGGSGNSGGNSGSSGGTNSSSSLGSSGGSSSSSSKGPMSLVVNAQDIQQDATTRDTSNSAAVKATVINPPSSSQYQATWSWSIGKTFYSSTGNADDFVQFDWTVSPNVNATLSCSGDAGTDVSQSQQTLNAVFHKTGYFEIEVVAQVSYTGNPTLPPLTNSDYVGKYF